MGHGEEALTLCLNHEQPSVWELVRPSQLLQMGEVSVEVERLLVSGKRRRSSRDLPPIPLILCQVRPAFNKDFTSTLVLIKGGPRFVAVGETAGRLREWGAICPQPGLLRHSPQLSHGTQNPRALVLGVVKFQLGNGYTIVSAGKVWKLEQIWSNLIFARYSEVSSGYVARQMIAYNGSDAVSSSMRIPVISAAARRTSTLLPPYKITLRSCHLGLNYFHYPESAG